MRRPTVLCSVVLSATLAISAFGCRPSIPATPPAQPQNVVEVIQIFKGRTPPSPPSTEIWVRPPVGWASGLPVNPHPDKVQGVYSRGDKIWLGLRLAPKTLVTFSKYTFFNKGTGKEVEIGGLQTGLGVGVPASDLGSFGGQAFPFFDNPLWVPDEPGIYEIRAYVDDVIAASAVFEVKMEAVGLIMIFKVMQFINPPPTGQFNAPDIPSPHPGNIQQVFNPGDRMFLIVTTNPQYVGNITFSKHTFFNKDNGRETEIAPPRSTGPFGPGQIIHLTPATPGNSWAVPNEPGIYEIRIYADAAMVASAVFEVQSATYPRQISLEQANILVNALLPVPAYLPGNFTFTEFYQMAHSDALEEFAIPFYPIGQEQRGVADINKAPLKLYMSLYRNGQVGGLKIPGEAYDIGETNRVLVKRKETHDLFWIINYRDFPGQYELHLVMNKDIPKEEIVKIARSTTFVFTKITAPLTLDGTKPGTDIPWGSVVYHWADGITEVYGPDNNRIFIAKDSSAAVIIGPGGGRAATHGYQVPSGARIDGDVMVGNDKVTKIYMGDSLIMTIIEKSKNFLY